MRQNNVPSEFVQIFSDRPVTGADGLDFQFEGLARTLAELAWNPNNRTPFTAVVRGGWGRGKTTLLRQTERLLRESKDGHGVREVRPLWFNAWKYPSDDTVLAGLLGALLNEFRRGNLLDQLKFHIDNQKTRLARAVLHAAAPWAFSKPDDETAWAGRYQPVEEKRAFNDLFRDLFVQAAYMLFHPDAAIRDTGSRRPEDLWDEEACREYAVAIFLDDLDRCRQERVLQVLEAINLFLDLPGVCFYLGIDMERLESLLPEQLSGHKTEFLEKIVQISLDLPEISHRGAREYVQALIAETPLHALLRSAEDDAWDDTRVIAQVLGSRHPRHIKRFLNDLAMSLAVLRNTEHLGEGDKRVPARCVVAWHLLREALPDENWRELRALTANLDAFLRQWRAAQANSEEEPRIEGWSESLSTLARSGVLDAQVALLAALRPPQRDLLVHTGSPARGFSPTAGRAEAPSSAENDDGVQAAIADMEWIQIAGGTFQMGSNRGGKNERPVHAVTLADFEVTKYPVTNAQYAAFVKAVGARVPKHWSEGKMPPDGKENHPVVWVSWHDAKAFCNWLSERLSSNSTIQLLSEAQWEYTARGAAGREYPWGDDPPNAERCNYQNDVGDTTPVHAYPDGATPQGVMDLAGNVWEWTQDTWHDSYDGAPAAGSAWDAKRSGSPRVMRGGSWNRDARICRSACRSRHGPDYRSQYLGFRCVRVRKS